MRPVQEENETPRDFLRRTDALAVRLGIDIGDLPDLLGFSRASLFAYRTGKRPITGKAWEKLAQAERDAGLGKVVSMTITDTNNPEGGLEARLVRIETLLEELLGALGNATSNTTSSGARGKKI